MNCVTHGLGIILCVIGTICLLGRVRHKSSRYIVSCSIYSLSLLVLYMSSTLYHSFFALQTTRYIFEVFDHCAIYLLIAGSYTPYLRIALANQPKWDVWLLIFIWACCICGIYVEAFHPAWKYKSKFSLIMYLGMGWSCLACVPDLMAILPSEALNLLMLGGGGIYGWCSLLCKKQQPGPLYLALLCTGWKYVPLVWSVLLRGPV